MAAILQLLGLVIVLAVAWYGGWALLDRWFNGPPRRTKSGEK